MENKYYIAYGSNLNVEQMKWRCPGARAISTATLKNYRLMFKGSQTGAYLTIEKYSKGKVPVVVWEVTDRNIKALDRYEGYPNFYYKKDIRIKCDDGHFRDCFAYIMHERNSIEAPHMYYVETCLEGYQHFGFDVNYLWDAVEYSGGIIA